MTLSQPIRLERATRISISVLLVVLITLLGSQSIASQSSDWVERIVVTQYVKNLLDTYNSLVNLYYGYYPDSHVLDRFRLYHAVGYSFNVTVMRFNSTTKAFVVFVFVPIMAASPLVIINNNDTFIHFQYPNLSESFESSMSALLKPNNTLGIIQVGGTSVGPNGTRLASRVWIANATTLFANIMKSSADAANSIFEGDQAGYNQDLARTQTTTQSTNNAWSIPEPIGSIPITWAGAAGFLLVLGYGIRTLVIDLFGSWKEFITFLVDKNERKRLADHAKETLSKWRGKQIEEKKKDRKTQESKHHPSKSDGAKT